ncbi:hypothetical protein [Methylobacterium sp. AMS5]|uniref:hypothetical protein n=1 Tax=Methylobacterium sp. AMS5 TaxID=925818 RepID=UPI00074F852F|nr:hypothetical protein [Methylobacterium sp. AMS5]AMB48322.1 hypothetical protein Y590_25475 [Methylobacterium sp. AMS5]
MSKVINFFTGLGRDRRQAITFSWCKAAFGPVTRKVRVERVLEEAIELAQAEGYPLGRIERLAAKVYARPPGDPAQEVGGIGIAILAYCGAAELSADECEATEVARVLSKPIEHFRERHQHKIDEGLCSTDLVDGPAPLPTDYAGNWRDFAA